MGRETLMRFATTFTPQGDGNSVNKIVQRTIIVEICHNLYPARGRKRSLDISHVNLLLRRFATTFTPQGDGNIFLLYTLSNSNILFATTFTPQGDGNH